MPGSGILEKIESERKHLKMLLTQKQREIIFYKQMLKDNNVEYESTHGEKNLNNLRGTIEEEEYELELEDSSPFQRQEALVNAGFPGAQVQSKN